MMLKLFSSLVAVSVLALAPQAFATDFTDRDLLTDLLTLDEQAALPAAEDALDDAQGDFDAAAAAATEAGMAAKMAAEELAQGIEDGLMGEELKALEIAAAAALVEAGLKSAAADSAEGALDDAQGVVDAINEEIDGTEEFVENLDDKSAFALNRSLNNAVKSGLMPLDIDLDVLQRIIDEDLGNGEIQKLTHAYEMEARFERLAARFDDRDAEKFASQADRARSKGQSSRDKFLGQIGDGSGDDESGDEVTAAAKDQANKAAGDAAREIARGKARGHAGEAASAAAKDVAGELAREIAKEQSMGAPGSAGRGLAKGHDK